MDDGRADQARMHERAAARREERDAQQQADLRQLAATLRAAVGLLVERGLLDGTELAARVATAEAELAAAERRRGARVRLHVLGDKETTPNNDVDCAARFALCRGACCGAEVELALGDVEEGALRWELAAPYLLRREADGRCTHQDRATLFCGAYAHRPTPCRTYSCAGDVRIWRDFHARLPNEKGIAALLAHRLERPLEPAPPPSLPRP